MLDILTYYLRLNKYFSWVLTKIVNISHIRETLEKISPSHHGLISAFNALIRNIGSVFGISISTILITSILISYGLNVQIGELINGSESELKILSEAMNYSFILSAGFGVIAIILSIVGRLKEK